MRGKSSCNTGLECALLVTISFLFHTTLFKDHKSPTPKSMLFLVAERLESVNLPDGTLEAATPQSCLLIKKCSDPSDLRITPRRKPSSSLSKSQPYPFWVVVAFCSTVAPDSIHVPVTRSVMVHGNLSWSGGVVETPVAIKYYILLIFFKKNSIYFCKILQFKLYFAKLLSKRFKLIGKALGFCKQIQQLEI